jgi:hypothetical protein
VIDRAASTDKTLKIWPGLRHEIFNEPEGPEVIEYMVGWLNARIANRQVSAAKSVQFGRQSMSEGEDDLSCGAPSSEIE